MYEEELYMFMFLSHPLDPEGYAWPGEPVVKTTQCMFPLTVHSAVLYLNCQTIVEHIWMHQDIL